jgi:transcriptional regulator with XRE-family HTH domain
MANASSAAPKNLASNILTLRLSRHLSQDALAALSGVPRSTVTYLESGDANPSLRNLIKIASALQVSIEELLQKPRGRVKLVKRNEIPVQKRANGAALVLKLLPDAIPAMELDRLELVPGGRMGGIPHTANTREYLTCISGLVEVAVSGETYRLAAGDVLAFPGDEPHSYFNPGRAAASCVSVVVIAHGI